MERLGTTVRRSHEVRDNQQLKLWLVLSWETEASPRSPSRRTEELGPDHTLYLWGKRKLNQLDLGLSPVGTVELGPAGD